MNTDRILMFAMIAGAVAGSYAAYTLYMEPSKKYVVRFNKLLAGARLTGLAALVYGTASGRVPAIIAVAPIAAAIVPPAMLSDAASSAILAAGLGYSAYLVSK